MKRTPLRKTGKSESAKAKVRIQALVREFVIKRDGGCILRNVRHCGGEIGQAVLQADHLITRGNSATYADERLIVCLCRPCHGGYKKWHKEEYDALIKTVLDPKTVQLWEASEAQRGFPTHKTAYDWKIEEIRLKQLVDKPLAP